MRLSEVTEATSVVDDLRRTLNQAVEQRNTAIRAAFNDGAPIREIAQAAHLTPARVTSILGHPFHRVGRPARTQRPAAGDTTASAT